MSIFNDKADLMSHRREATRMAVKACLEIVAQVKAMELRGSLECLNGPLYDEDTCNEITRRIKEELEP